MNRGDSQTDSETTEVTESVNPWPLVCISLGVLIIGLLVALLYRRQRHIDA